MLGNEHMEETYHIPLCATDLDDTYGLDFDEHGQYVELCFATDMSKVVLSEHQHQMLNDEYIATMRVYVSAASKRAVIVKEDDLLTKAEIQMNPQKISKALYTELKIWFDHKCFKLQELKYASNVMTSRYVYKWKFVKNDKGEMERTIRLRLVLRGFMGLEALSVETFAGTAKRSSQRLLARQRARSSGSSHP